MASPRLASWCCAGADANAACAAGQLTGACRQARPPERHHQRRRTDMPNQPKPHRVVIVGAGFAGFNAARELVRLVDATTEIVVINSTDYFLYLPLMPQVGSGLVDPRHICVGLPRRLRRARFVLGTMQEVD